MHVCIVGVVSNENKNISHNLQQQFSSLCKAKQYFEIVDLQATVSLRSIKFGVCNRRSLCKYLEIFFRKFYTSNIR